MTVSDAKMAPARRRCWGRVERSKSDKLDVAYFFMCSLDIAPSLEMVPLLLPVVPSLSFGSFRVAPGLAALGLLDAP